MNGFLDTISQRTKLISPMIKYNSPITRILSAQSREISIIPILPIKVKAHAISEEAEPVSSCCCSSIRLALGGRITLPASVDGSSERANNQGLMLPIELSSNPLIHVII